jgi:hypothetical protein
LLTDLGGESNGKEPQSVHAYIPHQIPKIKVSKLPQEKCQQKAPKITKKGKWEDTIKPSGTMPNHLCIPWRFIEGLACLPIIFPSHHEALKLVLEIPKKKWKRKIAKQNELGLQEMGATLSPLELYGGNPKTKLPL